MPSPRGNAAPNALRNVQALLRAVSMGSAGKNTQVPINY
jgi:hypothetical protein